VATPAHARAGPLAPPPELEFAVEGAHAVRHAAAPTLGFDLRVERPGGGSIRSVSLTAQIRIAATQRPYARGEQERLAELFGRPDQWSQTVRSLLWTHAVAQLPPFTGNTLVELLVPVTYDFEVAGARYLHALEDGEVPLELLFSGTVFYSGPDGRLQVASIAWDREAEFRMPVSVWREVMDAYFPNSAWLRLRRDAFDRLAAYKAERALPSWEAAIESVLAEAEEG
jgi:Family of unknown function (DUF6084)